MRGRNLLEEAERQLGICNACRYCEGYCAVFPALELRRSLEGGDIAFLAHLCHDCRACYYACMYAPPHEFGVNIPQTLSAVRRESYRRYSWPGLLSRAFADHRIGVALAAAAIALVAALGWGLVGPGRLFGAYRGPGAFYQVIPYWAMLIPGLVLSVYVVGVWLEGGARFWQETKGTLRRPGGLWALAGAAADAAALRYFRGGGPECYYPGERASPLRRILHALVFYGFLAALASTTLATVYQDLLGRLPPYALTSAPVVLGTLGGVAMVAGTGGLVLLKLRSDPAPADAGGTALDYVFLAVLGLAALTGLLTLVLRSTRAMGSLLAIHLGLVAALFLTMPYGKFVHFLYRYLALVKNRLEQGSGRPSPDRRSTP